MGNPRRFVIGLALLALAGCGTPATLSPAERAAQARQKRAEVAKEQALQQQAAAQEREQAQRAAVDRKAAYDASQIRLDPLPPDVHQVGSEYFMAGNTHAGELRHVCTGVYPTSNGDDGNDVDRIVILPNNMIEVKCKGPQERFRAEDWENAYMKKTGHR